MNTLRALEEDVAYLTQEKERLAAEIAQASQVMDDLLRAKNNVEFVLEQKTDLYRRLSADTTRRSAALAA